MGPALYLLCFEHVDNVGVHRIPSETGLLIPSVYVSQCVVGSRGYYLLLIQS